MPKIIKAGKVLTSNSLNAEMILSENTRKQNELDRIANDATRANVVEAIEIEYAPRLTTVESQLVDAETEINNKAEKPSILTEAVVLANTDLMTLEDAVGLKKISVAKMKETFADKAVAQMFKLTSDTGIGKWASANLNNEVYTGLYMVDPDSLNRPNNVYYALLEVLQRAFGDIIQRVISTATGITFTRVSVDSGATWTAWKELADAVNGIVESGSNSNGSYIKFGDGTMICYANISLTELAWVIEQNDGLEKTWTFPAIANSTLYAVSVTKIYSSKSEGQRTVPLVSSITTSRCSISMHSVITGVAFTAGDNIAVSVVLTGRWKA